MANKYHAEPIKKDYTLQALGPNKGNLPGGVQSGISQRVTAFQKKHKKKLGE